MSRFLLLVFLLPALAVIAGCKSAPVRSSYDAYADLVKAQAESQAQAIASVAASANACTDSRCVEHVAAMAALSAARGGSGTSIAPPPREPSGAEKFARVIGALSPILGTAVTGAVQWHQSDNATRQAEAQYSYLGAVVSSMADVATGATPSITVGGNFGDTYGADYTGGDRTDVAGHLISGDGTVIGDRNYNSGRQDSAGPFDRTCTGDACQPQPQPVDEGG